MTDTGYVVTVDQLKAIPASDRVDNFALLVVDSANSWSQWFIYNSKATTSESDDYYTIIPSDGIGRWFRLTPSDATNNKKGLIQLAGDLGGTAQAPTVPALGQHITDTNNPHRLTPAIIGNTTAQWNANQLQGRNVASDVPANGQAIVWNNDSNSWKPGTVAISPARDEATGTTLGLVQLTSDFSGSATSPIVAGLQGRRLASTTPSDGQVLSWDNNAQNWKPVTIVGGSGGTGATISDATTGNKGIIQLSGDLGGTATNPTITSNTTAKWNASQLQGRNVSFSSPSNNQVLGFNTSTNRWEPQTITQQGSIPDASTNSRGLIQLAGELGGNATSPSITSNEVAKWNASKLQGRSLLDITPLDGQVLSWSSASSQWQPISANTGASANLARSSKNYATVIIEDNFTENGLIVLGKSFALVRIQTSSSAWIRVYSTVAYRTLDATRTKNQDVTKGIGIMAEVITDSSNLIIDMNPAPLCASMEDTPSSAIAIAVTNLSGQRTSINVTFTKITLEN